MTRNITPREKATAGVWILKQAIIHLLQDPKHKKGLKAGQVNNELGLGSEEKKHPLVARSLLKWMANTGELETTGGPQPVYSLPANDNGKERP